MTALDITGATAALKVFYSKDKLEAMMYRDRPLFAMLDKKTDFSGEFYKVPLIIARPQGSSSTFTSAQNNKSPTNYQAFYLARQKHYTLASITTEAILASQNDAGAFLRLATGEIDGAIDTETRTVAYQLYGDSNAVMAKVSSITSANPAVVVLDNPEDVVKFELGQKIQAFTLPAAGSAHVWSTADGPSATVVAVDRGDIATVTLNVNSAGAGAAVVAGDYLFIEGNRGLGISGLAAWVPSVAPLTSDSFFQVNRSVDTRLSGQRVDCSALPIEEALIQTARKISREGGHPDHLFLSFDRYAALEKSLGTKVRYESVDVAGVSFTAIKVNGPKGQISILADQDCPNTKGYMLEMGTWSLYSLGPAVQILDLDGNKMLREASADAMEIRIGGFRQLGSRAPGWNGVMLF